MNWKQLKEKIYLEDGSLNDIYIEDFSREEWLQWIAYVNNNYQLKWVNTETGIIEDKIDANVVIRYFDGRHESLPIATLSIGNFEIRGLFFSEKQFENDINPNEFRSIEDHNHLMMYLIELSKLFNKEVLMTVENYGDHNDHILLRVNRDTITY